MFIIMKKLLLGSMAIATLAMVGCSNENDLLFDENTQEVFSGEIITSNSRTSLGENGKVLWSDGDAINLFKKTGYYQKYVVKQGGDVTTDFVYGGVSKEGPILDQHYAVYPYAEGNSINANKVISVDLSDLAGQTYVAGSFDPAGAVMVAKHSSTSLPFTNTLSMARVKISKGGSVVDATVQSIKFTSTDEALTGNATIDMNQDRPAAVISGSGKEITLTTNDAELSSEATPFYVLIPANTYDAKTLTLTVNATVNGEAQVITKEYDALNFQRSLIETFNIEITEDGNWSGSTDEEILTHIDVSIPEELAALLTSSKDEISVKLANDIDLPISSLGQITSGSGEYKLGGENTQNIIIDLNGKKLNITTTYWSNLGAKNDNALFTIKNGTMTSSQPTGTWNSYDLCFSNCNYVIEDVVFDKAIAFGNANKSVSLKNVTINETHDYYAMWIETVGQNVTIDGLTINSDGRGIKIDEQYVDAPAKVTLNISNATFNTAKKAAILVKSEAGAEINASNLNLSGVAADNYHAVWVDEDAAAYADKVIVKDALKAVEGTVAKFDNPSDLAGATIENNSTILLSAGDYVIPAAAKGKHVTFIGTGNPVDVKVGVTKVGTGGENCDYGLDGSTVTFENITITTNSSTYIGYARCNGTYKNCIINGTYTLYGNSYFENCTFNVSGDVYNIWTWGAPTATFVDCTFNSDGKSMLLYGQANTKLTINGCTFNDNGTIAGKAAIEIGNDYNKSYELTVNNTIVKGFDINTNGISTGTTLWANKNSMGTDKLNVVVDGVDVY